MVELEIQVHSDRREGLLTELGHVVVTNHFSLLRQRLTQDSRGAWLSMLVRGPDEQRFALEEMLGTHTRVLSFEAALTGEVQPLSTPAAPVPKITETMAQPVVEEPAPMPEPPVAPTAPVTPDISQVEHILPKLAQDYPHIYPWLVALENSVADSVRESSLMLAGRRTGAWVYKRDYAMGAKLSLSDAIKRIGVPALKLLADIEQHGVHINILNSPLCTPGVQSGCKFYGGYLEGLLGASVTPKKVFVRHLSCRSAGAAHCSMEISH
jgi:predicted hydrocarbon binding protein